MATLNGLALAFLYLSSCCLADVNVTEYIFWKKADVEAWHNFFPVRGLQEEYQTNLAAVNAVFSMSNSMSNSLARVLAFQVKELQTAQLMMNGTNAEGCINGISDFITNSIESEVESYTDCSSDAISKLYRLNNALSVVNASYWTAYHRTMSGIDVCTRTYPNKASYARLKSCVESMNTNYFTAANSTQNAVFPSPSMKYFQTTVVECANTAARETVAKGLEFIKMLIDCAALCDTVDPASYAQDLNKWGGYNDTLTRQILESQNKNYYQVYSVESLMIDYYKMQKQRLEQYVVESRGIDFYLQLTYSHLSDYYNTLTATSLDNPGDPTCITAAKAELDGVASASAIQSLACDIAIINNTKSFITDIYDSFWLLNRVMPSIGNVVILNCLAQGYDFAPNTISACFDLVHDSFSVNYTDRSFSIEQNVAKLLQYEYRFYSAADLPCGGTSLRRLLLGGDVVLYNLERCLYTASGTTYSVTTPMPLTTTTSSSTTYSYSTTTNFTNISSTTPTTTYNTTTSTTTTASI